MFWAELRKTMYTPVNHSFTIQKWGLRRSKVYMFSWWAETVRCEFSSYENKTYYRLSLYHFLFYFIHGPRQTKACYRVYADREGQAQPANYFLPSLSVNRIIEFKRMYEWIAKALMILCACAGWSDSAHIAHVWRHFFTWRPIYELPVLVYM